MMVLFVKFFKLKIPLNFIWLILRHIHIWIIIWICTVLWIANIDTVLKIEEVLIFAFSEAWNSDLIHSLRRSLALYVYLYIYRKWLEIKSFKYMTEIKFSHYFMWGWWWWTRYILNFNYTNNWYWNCFNHILSEAR